MRKVKTSKQGRLPLGGRLTSPQKYENILGCNTSITHLAKRATLWGREMTQIMTKRLRKFWLTSYFYATAITARICFPVVQQFSSTDCRTISSLPV